MSREKPEDRIRNMKYKRDIDDIELLESEFKLKETVIKIKIKYSLKGSF